MCSQLLLKSPLYICKECKYIKLPECICLKKELMQSLGHRLPFCSLAGNADPTNAANKEDLETTMDLHVSPNVKTAREPRSRTNSTK